MIVVEQPHPYRWNKSEENELLNLINQHRIAPKLSTSERPKQWIELPLDLSKRSLQAYKQRWYKCIQPGCVMKDGVYVWKSPATSEREASHTQPALPFPDPSRRVSILWGLITWTRKA